MNVAEDAGEHLFVPHTLAYTMYHTQLWDNVLYLIGKNGDDAKYKSYPAQPPKPLMVPLRRPKEGEAPAFELGRELIERVGTRIEIKFNRVNPRDWPILFNAGEVGVRNNFIEPEAIAEMAGVADFDGMLERNLEYQTTLKLMGHPLYLEMIEMDLLFVEKIAENAGDPVRQQYWTQRRQGWQQIVMQKQMSGGGGGQPQPGGQPGGGAPTSQPQTPGITPGGYPAGTSYPALGQGPGSEGGAVGRPGVSTEGP
jgi:hypothetical protein